MSSEPSDKRQPSIDFAEAVHYLQTRRDDIFTFLSYMHEHPEHVAAVQEILYAGLANGQFSGTSASTQWQINDGISDAFKALTDVKDAEQALAVVMLTGTYFAHMLNLSRFLEDKKLIAHYRPRYTRQLIDAARVAYLTLRQHHRAGYFSDTVPLPEATDPDHQP